MRCAGSFTPAADPQVRRGAVTDAAEPHFTDWWLSLPGMSFFFSRARIVKYIEEDKGDWWRMFCVWFRFLFLDFLFIYIRLICVCDLIMCSEYYDVFQCLGLLSIQKRKEKEIIYIFLRVWFCFPFVFPIYFFCIYVLIFFFVCCFLLFDFYLVLLLFLIWLMYFV